MRANYERFLNVATNGDLPRTIHPTPHRHLTTFNEGELIPIMVQEVLPNTTIKLNTGSLVRGATPIFPVMDDSYCETFYFFVPNRILWDHWREFLGENTNSYWNYDMPEYSVPQMTFDKSDVFSSWSLELMDYFNLGTASYKGYSKNGLSGGSVDNTLFEDDLSAYNASMGNIKVSALPFRGYNLIYNHYFRDENTTPPVPVYTGDNDENYWAYDELPVYRRYKLRKASRYHDYFSSALPQPQKGMPSYVPIEGYLDVITGAENNNLINSASYSTAGIRYNMTPSTLEGSLGPVFVGANGSGTAISFDVQSESSSALTDGIYPVNLYANAVNAQITVEGLRQAIAIQRVLELKARGGSRYVELLNSFFDVMVPDATIQIPEYLGGQKTQITMQQIAQMSSTNDVSPLGTVSAISKTTDQHFDFEKSFVEHGWIIGLQVTRVNRTYQQGIERQWMRKDFYDFYLPQFANIGEQPIYNYEIFATGFDNDNEVFGYQEAHASYKYKPSHVSGLFRTNNTFGNGLDAYHYADYYTGQPILSPDWMEEGTENIDKTLAVEADKSAQFYGDFYFDMIVTLPMPYDSIPSIEARF